MSFSLCPAPLTPLCVPCRQSPAGEYSDAGLCFSRCRRLYQSKPWGDESQFVWLSEAELTGYTLAVNGSATPPPQRPLYHRLRRSIANGYRVSEDGGGVEPSGGDERGIWGSRDKRHDVGDRFLTKIDVNEQCYEL